MKRIFTLCLLALLGLTTVNAQNTLNNIGLTASTPAASAYSLRKLSSSYAGSVIQVRRSNDNATQNIGFTSNGNLDTASLKTFVGSNNGLVTIWYDQSGNARNLTQTTAANQPTIIKAGIVFRRGYNPTIFLDGIDDGMAFTGSDYLTANPLSVNLVAGSNSNSTGRRRAIQGSNNWLVGPYQNMHSWFAGDWNHQISTPWSMSGVETFTVIQPVSNNANSWRNGAAQTSNNFKTVPGKLGIGTGGSNAEPFDGFISEFFSFKSELNSTTRIVIEQNQTNYFTTCTTATILSITNINTCPSSLPYSWNGLIFTASGTQTANITNTGGCGDSLATLNLIVSTTDVWTGATNTNWNIASNWCSKAVPIASSVVTIPAGLTNYPVIGGGTNAVAFGMFIDVNASLTLNANSNLTINGELSNQAMRVDGTLNNTGIITIGATANPDMINCMANNGTINNNIGGEINLYNSPSWALKNDAGSFTNSGKINVGSASVAVGAGIQNSSNFINNVSGEIKIDNTAGDAGFYNSGGTFTNSGKLTIGSVAAISGSGIYNEGDFTNNASGEIKIDNTGDIGFQNFATFTNSGKLTIGAVATTATIGIYSEGAITNNAGGEIKIDHINSNETGMYLTAPLTNAGIINIGSVANGGATGIVVQRGNITNNATGEITINRTTSIGLNITSGRTFTNSGKLIIGSIAIAGLGVSSAGTFNNNACATALVMAGGFKVTGGTATNNGYLQVNNTLNKTAGTVTNNGVLKYGSLSGSIVNTNNAAVIVKNDPTPIFTYGGTYTGTINGIYTDAATTISAGSFSAPNSFVSSAPGGLQTLYAKITPSGGACSYSVPFTYNAPYNITVCSNALPYSWNGLTFNAAGTQTAHLTNSVGGDSAVTLVLSVVGTVPAITGASAVCAGSTTTLSNAVAGGVWFTNFTSQANINPTTGLVTAKSAGVVTIQYSKTGCGSITKNITIHPTPVVPTITYAPGTLNPQLGAPTGGFCVGKIFSVVGIPNVPAGVWSSTGIVSITNGGVVTINAVGAGTIKYTYTSAAGCINSRTMVGNGFACAARGVSVSGEGLVVSGDFTMYPNPAKSVVSLQVDQLIGKGQIIVTDVYGKQIKTQYLSMGTNTIDVSNFSKGMYFVSMITSQGKTTKKLVVE